MQEQSKQPVNQDSNLVYRTKQIRKKSPKSLLARMSAKNTVPPKESSKPNKYDQKICECCKKQDNEQDLYLCDRCDDGYHLQCIRKQLKPNRLPTTKDMVWICELCFKDEAHTTKQRLLNIPPTNCFKCKSSLMQQNFSFLYTMTDKVQNEMVMDSELSWRCYHCRNYYHRSCLSQRINAVNCSQCQTKIRKSCPKGHHNFMVYLNQCLAKTNGFAKLTVVPDAKTDRAVHIGLKTHKPMIDRDNIIRQYASLYYALETQRLLYTHEQMYQIDKIKIDANDASLQESIKDLYRLDEIMFERHKKLVEEGYFPPFEIVEDKVKGFYVRALENIPDKTILTEYVGDVRGFRDTSLMVDNDSIFNLLRTTRSKTSIDICPINYANMAKFLSGINNSKRNHQNKDNVQTLIFRYQGRARLIFYARKDIVRGEVLTIDYNAGQFQEYPTEGFE